MPRSLVQIPFAAGVDERTHAAHVVPGKLLTLKNGVFKKGGAIHKRRGFTALTRDVIGLSDLGAGARIAPFGSELVMSDGDYLYSYLDGIEQWTRKDQVSQAVGRRTAVSHGALEPTAPDVAYDASSGCAVYAWLQSLPSGSAFVYASVVDVSSGTQVLSATRLISELPAGVDVIGPRVLMVGTTAIVTWLLDDGTCHARALNMMTMTAWGSDTVLFSDAWADEDVRWDAAASSTRFYVAYDTGLGAGSSIRVREFDATLVQTAFTTPASTPNARCAIAVSVSSANLVWLAYLYYAGGNTEVRARAWSPFPIASGVLVTVQSTIAQDETPSAQVAVVSTSGTGAVVAWSEIETGTGERLVRWRVIDAPTAAPVMPVRANPGLYWGSKPFRASSRTYALVYYESTTQPTAWVVDLDSGDTVTTIAGHPFLRPVATIAPRRAVRTTHVVAAVAGVEATRFVTPVVVRRDAAGKVGIDQLEIDFAEPARLMPAELGGTLHLSGGVPGIYDRANVIESAVQLWPEVPTSSQTPTASTVENGVHGYALVPVLVDNYGQQTRGVPTFFTITVAGGPSEVELLFPVIPVTLTGDAGASFESNLYFELYRTVAGGTNYFKIPDEFLSSTAGIPLRNDVRITRLDLTDSCPDAQLSGQPLLYTTGGVLENRSVPSARYATTWQDRVVLAGTDDPKVLWLSKQYELGGSIGLHESLTITVEDGGDVTAIASMDGNLLVFKRDRIFVVSGAGPNKTGAGAWSIPQRIASDVGSISPWVGVTPMGLVFRSTAGIYMLDRSLQAKYLSGPVEDTLSANPTLAAVVVHEEDFEVRFFCNSDINSTGVTLVWNYAINEWSVFEVYRSVDALPSSGVADACLRSGTLHWLGINGATYAESSTEHTDAGTWVTLQATTPWLKLGGLQGFQRAFTSQLLLERLTSHDLKLEVAFDYSETYSDVHTWVAPRIDAMRSESLERGIKRPKCTAIKFRITDATPTTTAGAVVGTGEGPALLGILLEVNQLPRRRPLPSNQRA